MPYAKYSTSPAVSQTPKTAQVTVSRLVIIHRHRPKPTSGKSGASGTRNERGMSGRVRRSTITAMFTSAKAKRVPMLVASASCPSGTAAARPPQNSETSTVLARGVPVRGWTWESTRGISPSRDMAKRIRVWP